MTVSSTLSQQSFSCDGTSTVFTLPFRVLASSEVVGYRITVADNTATLLRNGVDFTVSGVGAANAIVTTTMAYAAAYQLRFLRSTKRLQPTDYRDNDPFPAESHEEALDRLTHIAQELDGTTSRALLFPEPETGQTLPSATSRAGKALIFDSAGALTVADLADVDGVIGAAFATETLVASAGQTDFTLTSTSFTPGTDSLTVNINGRIVQSSEIAELSSTSFRLAVGQPAGTVLEVKTGRLITAGVAGEAVSFTAAGSGAVSQSIQTKARQTIHANDYSTVALAVAAATVSGNPTDIIVHSAVDLSATLSITASNITLVGAGADIAHDVGTANALARARFNWTGAPGGTMVEFTSTAGASAQKQNGGGVKGIAFVANGAARCISVKSWNGAVFEGCYFHNPTSWGIDFDVISGSLGEGKDTQYNLVRRCWSRHVESETGGLVRFGGDASANASFNRVEDAACQFLDGNAYQFDNSDNNLLIGVSFFRASGGTGNAFVFNGSNDSSGRVARSNVVMHPRGNSSVPSVCRGTSSFTYPSIDNVMLEIDADNSMAVPTFEAGAKGRWTKTDGSFGGYAGGINSIGGAFGNDATSLARAVAALGTSSLYIDNGSDAHMALGDGTNRWGLNIVSASGNLRLARAAGSGSLDLGNGAPVLINGKAVTEGAADSGGTGFKVLRVPN